MFGLLKAGGTASSYTEFDQIASSGWQQMAPSAFEDTLDAVLAAKSWEKSDFQPYRMKVSLADLSRGGRKK